MVKKISTKKHWDDTWERWGEDYSVNNCLVTNILKLFKNNLSDKKILEIGCGRGTDLIYLAQKGADVYGNDYSQKAVEIFLNLAKENKVKVSVSNENTLLGLKYPDNNFDLVFSQGVMEHFEDPSRFIFESIRVVKPDGYLIIDIPQKFHPLTLYKYYLISKNKWFAGWETSYSIFELKTIAKLFGLQIVKIYYWGKHTNKNFLLNILDFTPFTSNNIGVIYKKHEKNNL